MNAETSNVLLVGADPEFSAWVGDLLGRVGYSVSHAPNGEQALDVVRRERPHCLVLEVLLPGITGYAVCQEVRRLHGEDVSIIFVSAERTEVPDRVAGLLLGADDYIVKPFHPDEFLARVRRAVDRARHQLRVASGAPAGLAELTAREREVLALLAEGRDQADIAVELFISPTTVSTHIQRILSKLGVHSRAQAVAVAHLERLVELPAIGPQGAVAAAMKIASAEVASSNGSVATKSRKASKAGSRPAPARDYDFLVAAEAPASNGNQHVESDHTPESSEPWWMADDTAHARVSATTGELTSVTAEWANLMLGETSEIVGRHFMDFVAPEARTAASGLLDRKSVV